MYYTLQLVIYVNNAICCATYHSMMYLHRDVFAVNSASPMLRAGVNPAVPVSLQAMHWLSAVIGQAPLELPARLQPVQ